VHARRKVSAVFFVRPLVAIFPRRLARRIIV
jgi:hypothetical protein